MQSIIPFVNGNGNKAMNLLGSLLSPQVYTIAPDVPTQIISITCVLNAAGLSIFSGFSGLLGNGILIEQILGGVTTTLFTIKDKADLCACFNSGISEALSSANFIGTLVTSNLSPLTLLPGDSLRVTVRDTLLTIGTLNMMASVIQ